MPDLTAAEAPSPTAAQIPDPTVMQTLSATEGVSVWPSPFEDLPVIAPEGTRGDVSRGSTVTLGLAIAIAIVAVLLIVAVVLVIRMRRKDVDMRRPLAEPLEISDGSDSAVFERAAMMKLMRDRERL
jgi:hypothetical protein